MLSNISGTNDGLMSVNPFDEDDDAKSIGGFSRLRNNLAKK
jgi:hypothetical protein